MTKTEFLLKISIQYQAAEWCEERKMSIMGVLVYLIPNSLYRHHKNCMAYSKENYIKDLGSERVKQVYSLV